GDFRYTEVNPAGAEMVGLECEQLVNRRPDQLFSEEVADRLTGLYRRVVDTGEPDEITHVNQVPGGEVVTRSRLQ
ncbi:MAG: PAS domain-containing protein, partial [Bradymonadaceae bacterium]